MKILKDAGHFTVLTPVEELKAQLLRIERAGRTCYQSEIEPITEKTATAFIGRILRSGHESVIEHGNMTVQFNDLSRGFTHEQVRHRLTAICQESTRYVDYDKAGEGPDLERFQLKCVAPPHRNENEKVLLKDGRHMSFAEMAASQEMFYRALRKSGWASQDARQILPIGTKSQIVITANFREWRHIFKMRVTKRAHWEIRRIMCDLLDYVKPLLSPIFDDFIEAGTDKNGLRYFEKKPW